MQELQCQHVKGKSKRQVDLCYRVGATCWSPPWCCWCKSGVKEETLENRSASNARHSWKKASSFVPDNPRKVAVTRMPQHPCGLLSLWARESQRIPLRAQIFFSFFPKLRPSREKPSAEPPQRICNMTMGAEKWVWSCYKDSSKKRLQT